jgi:cytoskeletal protein CcmA (bactofilin family)
LFKRKKNHSIDTLIDETMNIRGSMNFSGGIRLDGKLYGNLTLSDGTAGSVIMGPKSKILGNIKTDTAIIAGEVKGNIEAQDFLELHSTAIVSGDIAYGEIEIHSGALLNGNVTKIKKSKTIKKIVNKKEKSNDQ